MNTLKSSSDLKAGAREKLFGHYLPLIAGFFIMEMLVYAITALATRLLPGYTTTQNVLYYMVAALVQLLMGVFYLGQARMYMNLMTGREVYSGQIFSAFRDGAGIGIAISSVKMLITFACEIPAFLCLLSFYFWEGEKFLLFAAIPLAIVGGLVSLRFQLMFSQCYYLSVDFPDMGFRQIMAMSSRVMKGHCLKLLKLYLSFIPLALATICSFGIGIIYFYPYENSSLCAFYLDLMEYQTRKTFDKGGNFDTVA